MANDVAVREDGALAKGQEITEGFNFVTRKQSAELAAIGIAARVRAEVEASFVMAQRNPRSEDDVRVQILKRCKDSEFAAAATYSKPIGNTSVRGFSIRFAEEFLRIWGNVQSEMTEIYDDEEKRIVQIVVRDLQTNALMRREVSLLKTVERREAKNRRILGQRVNTRGDVVFILEATEDEMQVKEAAQISKTLRQIALRMLPAGLKAECDKAVQDTLRKEIKQDPDAERKKILDAFSGIGISPADLKAYLKQDVKTLSPAQLVQLRELYTGIKEGTTTWAEAKATNSNATTVKEDSYAASAFTEELTPGDAATHTKPVEPIRKKKG